MHECTGPLPCSWDRLPDFSGADDIQTVELHYTKTPKTSWHGYWDQQHRSVVPSRARSILEIHGLPTKVLFVCFKKENQKKKIIKENQVGSVNKDLTWVDSYETLGFPIMKSHDLRMESVHGLWLPEINSWELLRKDPTISHIFTVTIPVTRVCENIYLVVVPKSWTKQKLFFFLRFR